MSLTTTPTKPLDKLVCKQQQLLKKNQAVELVASVDQDLQSEQI